MWRSPAVAFLVGRITRHQVVRVDTRSSWYSSVAQIAVSNQRSSKSVQSAENSGQDAGGVRKQTQIGENVSRKDKINFLISALHDLKDNKEAVYGALDAWVAWEQNFPIASIKRALIILEKEQQWHRVIQVIKWMLSKGQGTTLGTYGQLIRALDMDQRAEEAHRFWVKKIGMDLHSVPWQLCRQMISIYHRNNMLEHLVKLFKRLEAFDRKAPEKSIVQRVADAYEMLGLLEEKNKLLEKYDDLFNETRKGYSNKSKRSSNKKKKKPGKRNTSPASECHTNPMDDIQTS